MKILFVDKNKSLCQLVRKAMRESRRTVRVYNGDIFSHKGVVVSASNPSFSMGGGLDAQIAKRFPEESRQASQTKGNKRIGSVIFTVTVDKNLNSRANLVRNALRCALKNTKPKETLLLSGLGTGIGGLDHKLFCKILVEELSKTRPAKKISKVTGVTRWKFLREGMKSSSGDMTWKIGQWQHQSGKIDLCSNGLHCSKTLSQAFGYVQGEIVAKVEVKGESDISDDKEAYSDMRIIKAYAWTKNDSVSLAVFAAEQVVGIFEKYDSKDKRPRQAIEAAKEWLAHPTEKNRAAAADAAHAAAYAAYAAYAAAAAHAAHAAAAHAAHAAAAAAYAAAYAAHAAADAAYAAAHAAYAAYAAAARKGLVARIDAWMEKGVKTLKEIK